jgi:nucleoside 2-deoxyribosyltransferase
MLFYLASPYSKFPGGTEMAAAIVAQNAALLLDAGIHVFCPITHSHDVSRFVRNNTHEMWMSLDEKFMRMCDAMIVLEMDGWEASIGVQAEIDWFTKNHKPVVYMELHTVPRAAIDEVIADLQKQPENPACYDDISAGPARPGEGMEGVNPKDLVGSKKVSLSKIPPVALAYCAEALMDGAGKYGPYNWREKPVVSHIYVDAAMRHLLAWFDGEEFAADSTAHHLGHAMACCAILLDAMSIGCLSDDRPKPGSFSEVSAALAGKFSKAT